MDEVVVASTSILIYKVEAKTFLGGCCCVAFYWLVVSYSL